MEVGFGILKKILKLSSFLILITSIIPTKTDLAITFDQVDKPSANIVWEKIDQNLDVLGCYEGRVLLGSYIDKSYEVKLVDAATGKDVWADDTNDLKTAIKASHFYDVHENISYFDGKIMFASGDLGFGCFDSQTGHLLWTAEDSKTWKGKAFFQDGHGYVFDYEKTNNTKSVFIVDFDINTGAGVSKISFPIGQMSQYFDFSYHLIGKIGEKFYYTSGFDVYVFDSSLHTSKELINCDRWSSSNDSFYMYGSTIVTSTSVYCSATSARDYYKIFAIDANTGKELWSYKGYYEFKAYKNYILFKFLDSCNGGKAKLLSLVDITNGAVINKVDGDCAFDFDPGFTDLFISDRFYGGFFDVGATSFDQNKPVLTVFDMETHVASRIEMDYSSAKSVSICTDTSGNDYMIVSTSRPWFYSKCYNSHPKIVCFQLTNKALTLTPTLSQKWRKPMKLIASYGGSIVAIENDDKGRIDKLYCFDPNELGEQSELRKGDQLASFMIGKKLQEMPYSFCENLFVSFRTSGKTKEMVCFDIFDGKQLWANKQVSDCFLPDVGGRGVVYTSSSTGSHFKVPVVGGNKLGSWIHLTGQNKIFKVCAITDSKIVIYDDRYKIFDIKTEKLLWSSNIALADGFKPSDVQIYGGSMFVIGKSLKTNDSSTIFSYDLSTGKEQWHDEGNLGFIFRNGSMYYTKGVGVENASVNLLKADPNSGKTVNSFTVETNHDQYIKSCKILNLRTKILAVCQLSDNSTGLYLFDDDLNKLGQWNLKDSNLTNVGTSDDTFVIETIDVKTGKPSLTNYGFDWNSKQ